MSSLGDGSQIWGLLREVECSNDRHSTPEDLVLTGERENDVPIAVADRIEDDHDRSDSFRDYQGGGIRASGSHRGASTSERDSQC